MYELFYLILVEDILLFVVYRKIPFFAALLPEYFKAIILKHGIKLVAWKLKNFSKIKMIVTYSSQNNVIKLTSFITNQHIA